MFGTKITLLVNRPSQGKLKVTNSFWQTQLGDCEKAQKQGKTRLLTVDVKYKSVCRVFLCR